MKQQNHKKKEASVNLTEIGYPIAEFQNMINAAKESGYHEVSANDIKKEARKMNSLKNL